MDGNTHVIKTEKHAASRLKPALDPQQLKAFVTGYQRDASLYLDACRRTGSPLYILEEDVLRSRAGRFRAAFEDRLDDVKFFYAVKSNNYPGVSRILIDEGFGLDVSSGEELRGAIDLGAKEIVFSGPGKTLPELRLAVENANRVTTLIDSFGELKRLEQIASEKKTRVKAGVRLTTDERGLWRKFGIPVAALPAFIKQADDYSHVDLCGLQFHTSWNLIPDNQAAFLARLGEALVQLDNSALSRFRFIDIGGGYWPEQGEWLHAETGEEQREHRNFPYEDRPDHVCLPAAPIEQFAERIANALRDKIFPHVKVTVCLEPGRWICHDSMHILLTVIDKKHDDLVITDGGTNIIGWERLETDYFPVINLTNPGTTEKACLILGSLCTPHDVWGYWYFGTKIDEGDILLIPTQGAYTYSLRQNFIKPLPEVVTVSRRY